MVFPPVIERELRTALRKYKAVKSRFRLALIGSGVVGFFLFLGWLGFDEWGRGLYGCLFFGGLSLAVIPPARISVGLFCEERRNQTLELLYLTGMGPGELFTGKLLGGVLIASGDLLALIPFMAVPFLGGGLSLDLFRASLACFPVLFLFTVAIGVLASVLSRDDGAALVVAVLLAGGVCLAVPLPYFLGQEVTGLPPFSADWLCLSPAYGPWLVVKNFGGAKPGTFWTAAGMTVVWALAGLVLAAVLLRRNWRQEIERTAPTGWRAKWLAWLHGPANWRAGLRGRLLCGDAEWGREEGAASWQTALHNYKQAEAQGRTEGGWIWPAATHGRPSPGNPFQWLAEQDRRPVLLAWAVIAGTVLFWLLGWSAWPGAWPSPVNLYLTALLLAGATGCIMTYAAAKTIGQARQDGSLELLLTTPLLPGQMVTGQIAAHRAQFRPVRLVLLGLFVVMMLGGFLTRTWNERAAISYTLIWCFFFGWCLSQSPRSVPRAMWVGLNTGRPTFAVFHFNRGGWWYPMMFSNARNLWGGLTVARKFPSGSQVEFWVIFVGSVITLAVLAISYYFPVYAGQSQELLCDDMRAIAQEPVPDARDPRLKNWSGLGRLPDS